jgi:hypothetical protein
LKARKRDCDYLTLNSPARFGLQQLTIHMGHRPNARDADQQPVLDSCCTRRIHRASSPAAYGRGPSTPPDSCRVRQSFPPPQWDRVPRQGRDNSPSFCG